MLDYTQVLLEQSEILHVACGQGHGGGKWEATGFMFGKLALIIYVNIINV